MASRCTPGAAPARRNIGPPAPPGPWSLSRSVKVHLRVANRHWQAIPVMHRVIVSNYKRNGLRARIGARSRDLAPVYWITSLNMEKNKPYTAGSVFFLPSHLANSFGLLGKYFFHFTFLCLLEVLMELSERHRPRLWNYHLNYLLPVLVSLLLFVYSILVIICFKSLFTHK